MPSRPDPKLIAPHDRERAGVAAVVLAAGGGSRFEGPTHKLLAPFQGRPLVAWAFAAAEEAGFDELVVVQGAVDLAGQAPSQATLITNLDWERGQATSLGVAVDHARARGHSAIVVGLGDQPLVPASAWRAVGAAGDLAPIVVATYGERRGNPVRLAGDIWDQLVFDGDEGARELMRRRPDLCGQVACHGDPADFDTMEDFEQWS